MTTDIGLYIHIPFCIQKCNYCAFSSFADISADLKEKYVNKLVEGIIFRTKDLGERNVKWIYFGGGTPNTLSVEQIKKIVDVLPDGYEELSIELNPGVSSVETQDFASLQEMGFNRLSIGVQSFNDDELRLLGRIHDSEAAKNFLSAVKNSDFANFNIDLMMGLPNLSIDSVLKNIETAASFEPTHLSAYLLSIDQGTHFENLYKKGLLKLPEDAFLEDMYFSAVDKLESFGYKQYEISNFAKPGFECKYNLNTWRNGQYIGCGLSAGNFINGKRFENTKDLKEYIYLDVETLHATSLQEMDAISNFETKILLGLRLREGVNIENELKRLPEDYHKSFNQRLQRLKLDGSLVQVDGAIMIPEKKVLLLDMIIEELLV